MSCLAICCITAIMNAIHPVVRSMDHLDDLSALRGRCGRGRGRPARKVQRVEEFAHIIVAKLE